jgi:predicted O-linked N-acetylglucosamine transferase (SPINDLY family)
MNNNFEDYQNYALELETAIQRGDNSLDLYWDLGAILLFQGEEDKAQATWMSGFSLINDSEIELVGHHFIQRMKDAAYVWERDEKYKEAWLLRRHVFEYSSNDILGLCRLILSANKCDELSNSLLDDLDFDEIQELITQNLRAFNDEDRSCFKDAIGACITKFPKNLKICDLLKVVIKENFLEQQECRTLVLGSCLDIAYKQGLFADAAKICHLYLHHFPNDIEAITHLIDFYFNQKELDNAFKWAKQRYEIATNQELFIQAAISGHLMLKILLEYGGRSDEAGELLEKHISLISSIPYLSAPPETEETLLQILRFSTSAYFLPYLRDDISMNRKVQNSVSEYCDLIISNIRASQIKEYRARHSSRNLSAFGHKRKLKVGYLSYCLREHSVGWLTRWLIGHHDRENFEIYGYLLNYKEGMGLQEWYARKFDYTYCYGFREPTITVDVTTQIYENDLDLLIDLDSITLDLTCDILSVRAAPVQATWLGWDATGLPGVDYFIADPYVLPDNSQEFYREKIVRLPETYIAVDGFEVQVPRLRRNELKIPTDAVTYLTAQRGYKHNDNTARLQVQIISEVPNSYLLVKGFSDLQSLQKLFEELFDKFNVSLDRLILLPESPSEAIHRGNLNLADVVLDTYPYNGATTTLETLWMGIPIVTRVGQQFASRNSYTMMMNAGITEGISWTAEEYVEWGVRFGRDEKLRQEVSWKLRQSRHTAPLWDGKRFTRHMEDAYKNMIFGKV